VIILVALTVGGVLAGIMGAIAAIPVAAAVSAAVKYASGAEDIDGNAVPGAGRPVPEPPRAVQLPRARGR
jgi:predicted PurR-regulated permease PerM